VENDYHILNTFEPIDLKEMDGVKLMNRTDTKFTFNARLFDTVMAEVIKDYRILEISGKRVCRYKTLYYDTPGLDLYREHHNGKLNRYKIRHRTYLESDVGYMEVKFKNNKGRTIKTRIKAHDAPQSWGGEEDKNGNFLKKTLPFDPKNLVPVIWVNYSRLTLVNRNSPERLTIDLDLEFEKDATTKKLGNLVIAEVKQDKKNASPFMKVMKKYHVRPGSISKYCMGIALVYDDVKKNNFKQKLLTLKNKIYDELTTGGG